MTVNGLFFLLSFVAISVGMSLGGNDPQAQLHAYVLWGLGSVGILSAIRHIFLSGALRGERSPLEFANETFFEWEAGFANLAFGLTALVTTIGGWGVYAMSTVAIGYSIYLLGAAITHWLAGLRQGTLRRSLIFGAFTLGLIGASAWRVTMALTFGDH